MGEGVLASRLVEIDCAQPTGWPDTPHIHSSMHVPTTQMSGETEDADDERSQNKAGDRTEGKALAFHRIDTGFILNIA